MASNPSGLRALTARWRSASQDDYKPVLEPSSGEANKILTLPNLRDVAVIGLFFLAAGATLFVAQPIVVPVVAAIVMGSILAPMAARLAAHGIPTPVTAFAIVGLVGAAIYVLSVALAAPISHFIADMPRALGQLRDNLQGLDTLRRNLFDLKSAIVGNVDGVAPPSSDVSGKAMVEATVNVITPALTQLVIFLGSLLFFLWARAGIRQQIVLSLPSRKSRLIALRIMNDVESNLASYFATITFINIGLALATSAGLLLLNIEGAFIWGALAGIINYIPYVGPATVTFVLLIVGMTTQATLLQALIPPAMFIALTTVEGQFLTPAIVGRRLSMNPFLVFLSVVFWTWLWGPIGAFLAVPLLIMWIVASHHLSPTTDINLPG